MKKISIAIDGPAGSGKSTVAKIIAKKLGILYIDTGAMYRAVAYYSIKKNKDPKNSFDVISIVNKIDLSIKFINGEQRIILNNNDISDQIRSPEVSMGASDVATIPIVREKLVDMQRKIAEDNNVVMDGRDIASKVLPYAQLKIYLDASVDERAKRRFNEIKSDKNISINDVKRDIEIRDNSDKSRKISPLIKAKDAIVIDTSKLSIDEVVEKIIQLYDNLD